jgi:hypothetical protein
VLLFGRWLHIFYNFSDQKETKMSELTAVAKVLRQNTDTPGITPKKLSKLSGVTLKNVYKRVSDLREEEGREIHSNFRVVGGVKQMFYRITR